MKCEFEEKQFESALNSSLASNHHLIYAVGQYLENTVGFDAALVTHNRRFWRLFPHVSPWYARAFGFYPEGVELQNDWWQSLSQQVDYFPPLKFNVFIQHKRPFFRNGTATVEWQHWQEAYYKYQLTTHQQQALAQLSGRIAAAGVVVYASPAFYKYSDLWNAIRDNSLLDQTNFCEAHRLNNHSSYSYISGGNVGIGHSTPERIEGVHFSEHIKRLKSLKRESKGNKEIIIHWGEIVQQSALESKRIQAAYRHILADLTKDVAESRLATAFMRLEAFCFVTNSACFFGIDEN